MIRLAVFQKLTKLEQGCFGLPFVLAGAILPFVSAPFVWENRMLWILPAFFLARISGMAFNQFIDRKIDAQNPRTQNRALPSGEASANQAAILATLALVAFILVCWRINFLCFALSFVAAPLLFFYSYLKRFNALCHFVLGTIHLLGPVMAYAAITGTLSLTPLFFGASSLLLIAGSDIIYALQDVAFDRAHRLHSIPAKLGVEKGLGVAKGCHLLSVVALLAAGFVGHLPWIFFGAPALSALIFHFLHRSLDVALRRKSAIMPFFIRCNVLVALCVLLFTVLCGLWPVLL